MLIEDQLEYALLGIEAIKSECLLATDEERTLPINKQLMYRCIEAVTQCWVEHYQISMHQIDMQSNNTVMILSVNSAPIVFFNIPIVMMDILLQTRPVSLYDDTPGFIKQFLTPHV